MCLNDLEEIPGSSGVNPSYILHIIIQDSKGRIYGDDEHCNLSVSHLKRSLAEILGLTSKLAKREKENEIGQNAAQILKLLLDPSSNVQPNQKRSAEARRVSLHHFLNELLVSATTNETSDDASRVFFGLSEIEAKLSHNNK